MRTRNTARVALAGGVVLLAATLGAQAAEAATPPACTWYASPTGKTANTGRTSSSPLPLWSVMSKPGPGDVVCFMAGTYSLPDSLYLTRSGTASAPIVYRNTGGAAIFQRTAGGSSLQVLRIGKGTRYVEVNGLTIDGGNVAQNGFVCHKTNHVRVIGTTVRNTGSGGIVAVGCDYLTFDHNLVWHVGYGSGYSSAISINTPRPSDTAAGFHSFITNNVTGGVDDNSPMRTDGNGIIIDRGTQGTPPILIANNVSYMNFGRCVHTFRTSHIWDVNNTCYKNALREPGTPWGTGEINFTSCKDCYAINDVVVAWTYGTPFRAEGSTVTYSHNVSFGGKPNSVPASVSADPNQLRVVDPLLTAPPVVDPTATGQWVNAPAPWSLVANAFLPKPGSPLIDRGADPHTLLPASLRASFDAAMATDIAGHPRVQGRGWDIGAYEQ
jgi:hypothetical protein